MNLLEHKGMIWNRCPSPRRVGRTSGILGIPLGNLEILAQKPRGRVGIHQTNSFTSRQTNSSNEFVRRIIKVKRIDWSNRSIDNQTNESSDEFVRHGNSSNEFPNRQTDDLIRQTNNHSSNELTESSNEFRLIPMPSNEFVKRIPNSSNEIVQ